MPKFYNSIPPDLADWALRQSVFFVASAPLTGRHINVSPKGLPDASFAILNPNEVAYVDATGSGNETISHLRENGRLTIMFCSFDAAPRILRLFCCGSAIVEWNEPDFPRWMTRMGGTGRKIVGARAIIRSKVFKVQTSCGYGVPLLSLTTDEETQTPKPCFQDRETLGHFAQNKVDKNQLRAYQEEWNRESLDGLQGLKSAQRDHGQIVWLGSAKNWIRMHRAGFEMAQSAALVVILSMVILRWMGQKDCH